MREKRQQSTNLLPFQRRALSTLAQQTDVLVVNCDKNLGPAIIDTSTYINRAFSNHLLCTDTYKEMTQDEATSHMQGVVAQIQI